MKKILNRIGVWINNNYIAKLIVATSLELLKHTGKTLATWLTGLLLVKYFAGLDFITFYQCLFVSLWIKIVIFNFNKSNQ